MTSPKTPFSVSPKNRCHIRPRSTRMVAGIPRTGPHLAMWLYFSKISPSPISLGKSTCSWCRHLLTFCGSLRRREIPLTASPLSLYFR